MVKGITSFCLRGNIFTKCLGYLSGSTFFRRLSTNPNSPTSSASRRRAPKRGQASTIPKGVAEVIHHHETGRLKPHPDGMLLAAEKPLIHAGSGVVHARGWDALTKVARLLQDDGASGGRQLLSRARVREAMRVGRQDLLDSAEATPPGHFADLVAYEARVASIATWPFREWRRCRRSWPAPISITDRTAGFRW